VQYASLQEENYAMDEQSLFWQKKSASAEKVVETRRKLWVK